MDRTIASSVRRTLRSIYTEHFREPLSTLLFGNPGLSTMSRRELLDSPPSCVDRVVTVDDPETVTIGSPSCVGPAPNELREKVGRWQFDPPFVAEINDVELVGPNAVPVAPDGSYVLEGMEGSRHRVLDGIVRSLIHGIRPTRRGHGTSYDRIVPLCGPWSREFFHWFADYLPRLRTLERYEDRTGNRHAFLLPADPPDWLHSSLDLLEISPDRRMEWSGGRARIDCLVLPSLPRHTESTAPQAGYVQSPRALRWVRDRLRAATESVDPRDGVGRRLYVSRGDAGPRHVSNESDLRPLLKEYGFDVVRPERWPLAEQVATFAAAEVVCGPHGGGLLNTIYADEPPLLELFGARPNPCYFAIVEGFDGRYAALTCEEAGDGLSVDPERFEQLLSGYCSGSQC